MNASVRDDLSSFINTDQQISLRIVRLWGGVNPSRESSIRNLAA